MRIIFFGTSEFAIPSLREICDSHHEIAAVITQPDSKKGRRLKLTPPPTKVLALSKDIPVYQPQDASGIEAVKYLKGLDADVFVVVAFGQILKKQVLSIPKILPLNLHGSILPKYRGAAPTNWAIIKGDKSSGVTVIRMNEKMDEGDIILNKEAPIDDEDTNITLSEELSGLGAGALLEVIDMIESGEHIDFTKQDPSFATYAPKLKKSDGLIRWDDDAVNIRNMVRGFLPWPGAYTHCGGRIIKVLRAEIGEINMQCRQARPGQVIDIIKAKGIMVAAGRAPLIITHLQLEGKKPMDADSFVRGHKIPADCVLT